jgi:hypothetical protein
MEPNFLEPNFPAYEAFLPLRAGRDTADSLALTFFSALRITARTFLTVSLRHIVSMG